MNRKQGKTLREFVDGDPDSQGSKIVKARSPLSSDIPRDCVSEAER